jgi:hypothetical protein
MESNMSSDKHVMLDAIEQNLNQLKAELASCPCHAFMRSYPKTHLEEVAMSVQCMKAAIGSRKSATITYSLNGRYSH